MEILILTGNTAVEIYTGWFSFKALWPDLMFFWRLRPISVITLSAPGSGLLKDWAEPNFFFFFHFLTNPGLISFFQVFTDQNIHSWARVGILTFFHVRSGSGRIFSNYIRTISGQNFNFYNCRAWKFRTEQSWTLQYFVRSRHHQYVRIARFFIIPPDTQYLKR